MYRFAVMQAFTILLFSLVQGVDKWDAIGFGVLPFAGKYEPKHLKSRVLDLGPLITSEGGVYSTRKNVNVQHVDSRFETTHTGKGFEEFSRKLQRDISIGGGFKGFEASISSHYSRDVLERTDYYFSRISSIIERAHLRVSAASPLSLRSMVIPSVASYLQRADPIEIFRIYGSHVTTGLIVGGMLELWSSSTTTKFSSEEDFKVSAKVSFKSFLRGSGSLSREEKLQSSKMESREGLIIHGGSFRSGDTAVDDWGASLSLNAQEIQYLTHGAVPIWELIPDVAQSNRVRDWYYTVFGENSIVLHEFSSPPLSSLNRFNWPEARVDVPVGWKVISGGAKVEFFGVGQMLTRSYPIIERGIPIGWRVQSKDHLQADPGRIRAFATAIWDPFNNWDVKVATSLSSFALHPRTTATLPPGYTLVGGGADARWRGVGSLLVENYPSSSRSWTASSKDHLQAVTSTVVSYVIGIKPSRGSVSTTIKSLSFGPAQHPSGTIFSTRGSAIIGGGAKVSKGGVGNMLVNCYSDSKGKSFFASSKDHLEPDRRVITVYGIEIRGAIFVDRPSDVLSIDI